MDTRHYLLRFGASATYHTRLPWADIELDAYLPPDLPTMTVEVSRSTYLYYWHIAAARQHHDVWECEADQDDVNDWHTAHLYGTRLSVAGYYYDDLPPEFTAMMGLLDAAHATIHTRYHDYALACDAESCEPHSFHMWKIHNEPKGPLG